MSNKVVWAVWAAIMVAAIGVSVAAEGRGTWQLGDEHRHEDERHEPYAIGLWGDLPYSSVQETVGLPNLIEDMNEQRLAFSVHDGDLKTGNGAPICDDALYARAKGWFNSLRAPAVFTPGDNDWTDCDRPNNGGFDSLERLTYERHVLFATPFSLGQHRLRQDVQLDPLCLGVVSPTDHTRVYRPCVENRRWTVDGVTYATINIQGSCNNLCGDGAEPAEYAARNAADIEWMRETFAEARGRHSAAVMFIGQADPGFSDVEIDAPTRDPKTLAQTDGDPDGYQEFLLALRDEIIAFRRPVVYVHGDSHYFRMDKPLLTSTGARLENFTRLETFGNHADQGTNDVQWVKVWVDADSREVFSFQPQIVPANRTAVPAP
jgi:hypothetical protein